MKVAGLFWAGLSPGPVPNWAQASQAEGLEGRHGRSSGFTQSDSGDLRSAKSGFAHYFLYKLPLDLLQRGRMKNVVFTVDGTDRGCSPCE